MRRRRGRTRAVLVEAHHAKVDCEIVVRQLEAATVISGCVDNGRARGLVLGIVPWGVEPDHGSMWLDDADVVSPVGRVTATAIFSLEWVHSSPELAECQAVVQENLANVPDKRTHIRRVKRLPRGIAISVSAGGIIMGDLPIVPSEPYRLLPGGLMTP